MIVFISQYIIKKEGICMDNLEKVYNHMKSYMEEKGFPPTIHQIAETLNIKKYEAEEAFEQLEKSGRIKVRRIPSKAEITFLD